MSPNPTALVVVVVALLVIVIAYHNTQDNFVSALLGRPWAGGGQPDPVTNGIAQESSGQQQIFTAPPTPAQQAGIGAAAQQLLTGHLS